MYSLTLYKAEGICISDILLLQAHLREHRCILMLLHQIYFMTTGEIQQSMIDMVMRERVKPSKVDYGMFFEIIPN